MAHGLKLAGLGHVANILTRSPALPLQGRRLGTCGPGASNFVLRGVRLVPAFGTDQAATVQNAQGVLYGALREPGFHGDLAMADLDALPALSHRAPPKEKVDDKGGRAMVVTDQVAEEHIRHVLVDSKGRHRAMFVNPIAKFKLLYSPECLWHGSGRRNIDMLKRIKFTTIPVQDQGRALEFYTKKLGMKVFTDQTMGASRWIELQVPGAETLLVLFQQPDHQPDKMPAAVFVADNVNATYEELKAKGVEFTQLPKKEPWGEHAILKDSEGNLILFGTA